jgi:hypothetical protein
MVNIVSSVKSIAPKVLPNTAMVANLLENMWNLKKNKKHGSFEIRQVRRP